MVENVIPCHNLGVYPVFRTQPTTRRSTRDTGRLEGVVADELK